VLLASGCTGPPPAVSASSTAPAPASPVRTSVAAIASPTRPAPTPTPLTFHNSASQARIVATLIAFLDAYNAGHVDTALAMLTPDVVTSDCDYRGVHVTTANRTEAVREWLRERADDHDQLVLESVA